MKSRVVKTIISIFIFLLILAATFAVLQPAYRAVSRTLISAEKHYLNLFTGKTGLSISYKSLSPSVLTGLRFKSIVISDSESGENILSVDKISLSYNLSSILKGDLEHAFRKMTISNVRFDYNITTNKAVNEKLIALINSASQESEKSESENKGESGEGFLISSEMLEGLETALFALPFDIQVRNIGVGFSDPLFSLDAVVKELNFQKKRSSSLSGGINGYARMRLASMNGKSIGFSYKIDGTLLNVISGSSIILTLDDYPLADYTINRTQFLLRYADDNFYLQSTQRLLPYSISATLSNASADFEAKVLMNRLNPMNMFKIPPQDPFIEQFYGTTLTLNAVMNGNLRTLDYKWRADLSSRLSKRISPDEEINLRASGNNRSINVQSLSARGELVSGEFSGSYEIQTMKPKGELFLEYFNMPCGEALSGELYIDPTEKGFACFAPSLFFGSQTLSELLIDIYPHETSLDFDFSVTDYTHAEFDVPGRITLDGSFSFGDSTDLQASLGVENFFLDSIVKVAAFFADTKDNHSVASLAPALEPFISSTDVYVSTDFKTVTFNSPYSVFANTREDRQMLVLSFDGTEQSLQITQFDLLYGQQSLSISAEADYSPEDRQALMNLNMNLNGIPYQLAGIYNFGEWLSITGDYGLDAAVSFGEKLEGSATLSSFPVHLSDYTFSFGLGTDFVFSSLKDFKLNINDFEVEELTSNLPTRPKFSLSAVADPSGVVFSSVSFSDTVGTLDGSGYMLWNMAGEMFDSANLELSLSNQMSSEAITIKGEVTNPLQEELNGTNLMKDFFFSAEAGLTSVALSHFMEGQMSDDSATITVSATGTLENPYVNVAIQSYTMQLGGLPLIARGNASILENAINVSELEGDWNGFHLNSTEANVDLSSFSGTASSKLYMNLGGKDVSAPFEIVLSNLSGEEYTSGISIPDFFSLELNAPDISGSLLPDGFPLHVSLIRSPGRMDIMTDEFLGAYGELLDDGTLNFTVDPSKPVHFVLGGRFTATTMDLRVNDFYCDASQIAFLFNSDALTVYSGIITGSMNMYGLATDPAIDGLLILSKPDLNLPTFIPQHITTDEVIVEMVQNEIQIPETVFSIADTSFRAGASLRLDRLTFDSMDITLATDSPKGIPVDVRIPLLRIKGRATANASMTLLDNALELSGDIGLMNSDILLVDDILGLINNSSDSSIQLSGNTNAQVQAPFGINMDLNLLIGQKVQVIQNPLLRGLIAPRTKVSFTFDSTADLWTLKGDVILRGGEISYLSRNFYLKEGRIIMNENQGSFNPMVTLRAETREHDSAGNPVTITLSAIRQNVAQFNPTLYATPAKSENEIMSILGQIATGDSSSLGEMGVATVDYLVQAAFFRKVESALRDLGNFDIFSIRNSFFQNTVKNGLNLDNNNEVLGKVFSNFFDNSTVYIGKYFGDTIYAEALMHWTYRGNDLSINEFDGTDIVFQPEIGFELAAPFANIRLDSVFDLDLSQIGNRTFVPDTSITLSWRLTF